MSREEVYPDFLLNEHVAKVFRILHPFADDEISELVSFYRAIWSIEQKYSDKQASRLELVNTLVEIKKQKIKIEKRILFDQIEI